ncbi:capping protein-inhibiting regulator of actin dynamics isoform X2 [Suncus etruscus]|uniref:capping protein-inhibiting regulator of actin dynamics isoform X2 n=1 Tax=Suncus etruscus TaxID=109475 RepID=UPI0021109D25|nr:capping protein-inhibiting regulator of actin dynamics isoform X2 [Suncus etruscus]
MTVFLSLMGEQKVSKQFKQCHRRTSWAKSKLFSRLSSMFLRQLGKNIKFGQPPPQAVSMKKADSGEATIDEDLFSPMEIVTHQDVILSDPENQPTDTSGFLNPPNQPAVRSEMEEKATPVKPSRPKRHFSSAGTIESVNLDAIPRAIARLDNSAARHKLSVKPKNQRVSRRHRRITGDPLGEHSGLLYPLSLDQNGHAGEDKLAWHEEEPEPLDSEDKRHNEEYWRELEAKCKRQKAEAAEKRRLEEQRLQALEQRLWEENRRQELLEEGREIIPEDDEQESPLEEILRGEGPGGPGQERKEHQEDRLLEEKHVKERSQQQPVLEAQSRQETEKQRQEEEERELHEFRRLEERKREDEKHQLEEKRRQMEEERMKELRRQEEEERRKELRRQEEERMRELRKQEEEERIKELRRQEEEERMKELRRQEERMKELKRQEEEEKMKELKRQEEEARIKELRRQEEDKMKELRRQEEEKMKELKRQEEEEEKKLKELRRQEEEERMKELKRQEEEERMKELRRQEEEEKMKELKRQEEEEKMKELKRQEEEKVKELRRREEEEAQKRREMLRKQAEMETQRRQEAEKKVLEAERPLELANRKGQRRALQKAFAEKTDGTPQPELQEDAEEVSSGEKPLEVPQGDKQQGKREGTKVQCPQKVEAPEEQTLAPVDRRGEELRWREVDERQSMPRSYTFQVASGGKHILFPKVNLSPVTPLKETGLASAPPQEPKALKASPAPHSLPSALSVPHTAILVTGAQLCGPAVNLSQIKDTACRSLLGLSEEKKQVEVPPEQPARAPGDPRVSSGRSRPPHEPPSSETAALAEWVSIRSRILKNAESDKEPTGPEGGGEEQSPGVRSDPSRNSDVRKAPSIGAKFSIKPAWQKFSDGGIESPRQTMDGESSRKRAAPTYGEGAAHQLSAADAQEPAKASEKPGAPREPADTTEGCKFAKDLPSFLVPGLPSPPLQTMHKATAQVESMSSTDHEIHGGRKSDPTVASGEEKASPFGIKLRRTNYSLRFHSDQQAEQKKKKRHSSTGEGGGTTGGGEKETAPQPGPALLPQDPKPAPSSSAESGSGHSAPATQLGPPPANSHIQTPEHKATHKMPMAQKPALAPKPTSQTPPPSPLSKLSRPYLVELLSRRPGKPDAEPSELSKEPATRAPQPPSPLPQPQEEEQLGPERKPSWSSLPASLGEKLSQSPETERREKPVLQSRHSLDGSKLAEKGEPAQPLWITLALRKQKGFREQQATREERKQAREAKQAEKFSKDSVSISRTGSLHKPAIQHEAQKPEEQKPDSAVSRLERREHLKKANTLPTSVTVEISDSAAPAPLVKEVTKRLSSPDAAPVSTEPAWLALAKRKAKAWSDCPQIIK